MQTDLKDGQISTVITVDQAAQAVLDGLVNNAYRLQLSGESQRRLRSSLLMPAS